MSAKLASSAILLSAGLLTACGGGGGGGSAGGSSVSVSSATLNASNQSVASQDVTSTGYGMFGISQSALGVATTNANALYVGAFAHADLLPTYLADANAHPVAAGVVQSASYACSVSGSYTVSVNDADNSGTITAGDSFSETDNNCNEGSGTTNGTLGFRVNALSGSYGAAQSTVSITMSFSNLNLVSGAYTAAMNGSITVAGTKTGTNAFTQSVSAGSFSVSATYGSLTRSVTLSNYSASETRTPDNTYTYLSSISASGTLTSSGFNGTQAVTFSTPSALIRRGTDSYAYTGIWKITGANNSALRLTALSNTLVQLELDANGDGTFENTSTVAWNTLL